MFSHSFALVGADGRLLDWDGGFEEEFRAARELLAAGLPLRELIDGRGAIPGDTRAAVSLDYRTTDGIIHVDLWPSAGGATIRATQDVTRERRIAAASKVVSLAAVNPLTAGFAGDTAQAILALRRRQEEKTRQAHKDQALGRLTAGIAHDFNNLLMVGLNNAEFILKSPSADAEIARNASSIKRAVERGAALTRQLLAFTRQQPLAPGRVDLAELLRDFSQLILGSLGDDVQVHSSVSKHTWPVLADPSQLEVALLNLVLNARDAMPDGGKVTLRAENRALGAESPEEVPAGDYVLISIQDNGVGMSAETLMRACDPFFTTKNVGEGTGLGLSLVHGFARQSGGALRIDSRLGTGTTVHLYLPRCTAEAATASVTAVPESAPPRPEGERPQILLVDDNELVRETLAATLKSLDYRVLVADRGATALTVLESDAPIDLLFTDVVMAGGMNGAELAQRAAALRPAIKVLFSSGFARNALVQNGRLLPGTELLMKPYDID
jgi:signal transduction histidine kinase/CheY-like chemotaxis protein